MTNLPNKKYDIVLADPPWGYYGDQKKMGAAANHYPTMTDEEILELDINSLLNKNSILFMWVTSPRLDFGIETIKHWGLHYRGISFVWVKTRKDGVPIAGKGVRPTITKPTSELVIAASKTRRGRPLPISAENVPQVILATPGAHSSKPEGVQDYIDILYPSATKLELFARRVKPGWDVWGNEV
jgi:N6-adenosine-specific RNA methylase IME4